jgi:hypothetical protein
MPNSEDFRRVETGRSGVIDLVVEPQLASATELFKCLESCLQAEELTQKTCIKVNGAEPITLDEWGKTKSDIQSAIRFEIHQLHLPERESQVLNSHLDLAFLTDHTVTRPQFEALFNACPSHNIEYFMREYVWDHNTRCLLFFIRGYAAILQALEVAVDAELYYADYLDNAHWLYYRLASFHTTRTFFPFCNPCPQNTKTQCSFWRDVLTHIQERISGPGTKESAAALRGYFEGLNNPCIVPQTVEDFQRMGGV